MDIHKGYHNIDCGPSGDNPGTAQTYDNFLPGDLIPQDHHYWCQTTGDPVVVFP